jgi:hypothetical protein
MGMESGCNQDRSNQELNVLAHAVYFSVGPQYSVDIGLALAAQQQAIVASDEACAVEGGGEGLGFGTTGHVSCLAQTISAYGLIQVDSSTAPD